MTVERPEGLGRHWPHTLNRDSLFLVVPATGLESEFALPNLSCDFRSRLCFNYLEWRVRKVSLTPSDTLSKKVFLNLPRTPVFSAPCFLKF